MKRTIALLIALFSVPACKGESVGGPTGPVESVALDFCALRPTWMAVQNEGTGWQQITVPITGAITFDATERVSIAMTFPFLGNITIVLNVSRDEITGAGTQLFGCEEFNAGDREMSGTVSGLGSGDVALVSAADQISYAGTNGQSWTVPFLPNTSHDVVATRLLGPDNTTPDRVIVRRNVSTQLPPSTPIPVLNFAAAEAVAPDAATLTVSGIGTDFATILTTFLTANGTSATITNQPTAANGSNAFHSVPASQRIASDLHRLELVADNNDGLRDVTTWYSTPAATTIVLGPMVSAPSISTTATSPALRMRAQVASQADYPSAAAAFFSQTQNDFRFIEVLTTAGFLGSTPATWDLSMPDLSAAGFQAAWGLQSGQVTEWQVTAVNAGGADLFDTTPISGTTLASSTRFSPSLASAARTGDMKRPSVRLFGTPISRRIR